MDELTIETRTYQRDSNSHAHDYHQIVMPFRGRLELDFGHSGGHVCAGIGAMIPAGARHAFLAKGDNAFLVMDMPGEYASQLAFARSTGTFFPIGASLQGLLDFATSQSQHRLPAHLRNAWAHLTLDSVNATPDRHDTIDIAIRRAVAFMRERLAEPIRTGDIAAAAGLSLTRLHSAFRHRLALTPHAHLASLRLDAAERMLMFTSHSIAEIAIRTGHADQSAMTRALRRERGQTPAEIRRGMRGGISGGKA